MCVCVCGCACVSHLRALNRLQLAASPNSRWSIEITRVSEHTADKERERVSEKNERGGAREVRQRECAGGCCWCFSSVNVVNWNQ